MVNITQLAEGFAMSVWLRVISRLTSLHRRPPADPS